VLIAKCCIWVILQEFSHLYIISAEDVLGSGQFGIVYGGQLEIVLIPGHSFVGDIFLDFRRISVIYRWLVVGFELCYPSPNISQCRDWLVWSSYEACYVW